MSDTEDLVYRARGLAGLGLDKGYDELLYALSDAVESLEAAYRQACTNLATIRPDLSRDFSIGETADLYYDALLAGWGGIEGYDPGRKSGRVWGPERMRHDPERSS